MCSKARDDEIRRNSSSGGVFALLAKKIIQLGGAVVGAAMSSDCTQVDHIIIQSEAELHRVMGSKYIQSRINTTFAQVQQMLEEGRKILFSGTSCQVLGLRKFLKKDYDNLWTIDVICHGVPSEKLWQNYLREMEQKHGLIKSVSFRSKWYSWQDFGMDLQMMNRNSVFHFNFEDPFFLLFNSDKALRESCYNCVAKNGNCQSDVTLGDFWGIDSVLPEFSDGRGVSVVLLNTKKGLELFDSVKEESVYANVDVDYNTITKLNPPIKYPLKRGKERDTIYQNLENNSFSTVFRMYLKIPMKHKIKSMLIKLGFIHGGDGGIEYFK